MKGYTTNVITQIGWVILEGYVMKEATYSKEMIYIPREIREKLALKDGDKIIFEVTGKNKAIIEVKGRGNEVL